MSSTNVASYGRMLEKLERACVDVGRDPASVRKTWAGGCICAPTPNAVAALAEGRGSTDDDDDFDLIGTPQQLIDQMARFIGLGVDYFMLDCGGFPDLTTLETLITDVIPVLKP